MNYDADVGAFSGVIDTELGRHMQEKWYFRLIYPVMRVFIKTPLQGAQTQLYCCLEESIADHSGRYIVRHSFVTSSQSYIAQIYGQKSLLCMYVGCVNSPPLASGRITQPRTNF